MGESVLFLSDPRIALDLLQGSDADNFRRDLVAIFLDVHLPYMNGIDLLKIIRSMDGMANFPVIVMTGLPSPQIADDCKKLDVVALVEKPVTLHTFSKTVANLFHQPIRHTASEMEPQR
jgi:CheY-like chemotaxis protein